jgi:hypothetical protein
MSKTVYLETGNYKIRVSDSNEIILDTGTTGITRITGDLIVEGETTTVNTTNLDIEDNEILLNKGETGYSVTDNDQESGIRVDRGNLDDVRFVYDEKIAWNDPNTQTTSQGPGVGQTQGQGPDFGSFKLVSASGDTLALRVANINNSNAIYFEPGGTGTLRLGGSIAPAVYVSRMLDDNDIPNKKYVDDEINAIVVGAAFPRIVDGDSEIKITDNSSSGNISKFEFTIDGSLVAKWEPTHLELYHQTTDIGNIRFEDDTISGLNSNQDLELVAPGTGSVRVNDSFIINNRPSVLDAALDPLYDANGVKLYAKSPAGGDTGLYFVNTNDTRGEVISKNRALLFGLLF